MHGFGEMALNESFANDFQWFSYNTIKGEPRSSGNSIDTIKSSDTIWSYDNSKNIQPFESEVTETWKEVSSATLSITTKAGIELKQSIDIPGVGGSEFSISISTEATNSETKQNEYSLTNKWKIVVGPGEKVSIERVKTSTKGLTIYSVDYGFTSLSLFGTHGDRYNGHNYWGDYVNSTIDDPTGTMRLSGHSTKDSYDFKIIRTGPDGNKSTNFLDAPKEKLVKAYIAAQEGALVRVPGPH